MSVNIGSIILPCPVPWSTRLLHSVPLAAPDRHLLSTVRPQCGDAVKPARKCEGEREGESRSAEGVSLRSGGAGRCAPSGGVACGSGGKENDGSVTRPPSPDESAQLTLPPEAVKPPAHPEAKRH